MNYEYEELPGQPGDFIGHAPAVLRAGDSVVLFSRVSTNRQKRTGQLGRQVAYLRHYAEIAGLTVVAVVSVVAPGWHRRRFGRAGYIARRHGATILAHTTDRFIRDCSWWPKQKARPTQRDLHRMAKLLDGIRLATVVHPDADAKTIRSAHTVRGQTVSGRRGGRPRRDTPRRKKTSPRTPAAAGAKTTQ